MLDVPADKCNIVKSIGDTEHREREILLLHQYSLPPI